MYIHLVKCSYCNRYNNDYEINCKSCGAPVEYKDFRPKLNDKSVQPTVAVKTQQPCHSGLFYL